MSSESNPYAAPGYEPGSGATLRETGGSLSVVYEFTREDYIEYNLFINDRRKPYRRTHLVLLGGLLLYALLLLVTGSFQDNHILIAVFAAVAGVIAFFPVILRRSIRGNARRLVADGVNRYLFGRKRLTVDADGLTETGEYSELRLRWEIVENVMRSDAHIYLFLSSIQAIIVPRRAFATDTDFAGFFERMQGYQRSRSAGRNSNPGTTSSPVSHSS
jgi:hypothetical protein